MKTLQSILIALLLYSKVFCQDMNKISLNRSKLRRLRHKCSGEFLDQCCDGTKCLICPNQGCIIGYIGDCNNGDSTCFPNSN